MFFLSPTLRHRSDSSGCSSLSLCQEQHTWVTNYLYFVTSDHYHHHYYHHHLHNNNDHRLQTKYVRLKRLRLGSRQCWIRSRWRLGRPHTWVIIAFIILLYKQARKARRCPIWNYHWLTDWLTAAKKTHLQNCCASKTFEISCLLLLATLPQGQVLYFSFNWVVAHDRHQKPNYHW